MKRFELAVAGGGLTAARAIESYREAGGDGWIGLFCDEATLPYHRPALSKGFLRGETTSTPYVADATFCRDYRVEAILGRPVTSIHTTARMLTAGGLPFGYEKLLIATGAKARRLRVPGADLPGVFSLRTINDSMAIRDAAGCSERAVVVGGGPIGMEVAASLRQLGLAVTLIHLGGGLFDQLGSEQLSDELLALYREQGVDVWLEEEVASFGGDNRLEYVEARSGRWIEADMAVVDVGVVPNTHFLVGSGLAIDNGVVVNERFETSAPGVYAAGDVANFFDPLYGRHRRVEHWSNANYQGTEAGKILAGHGEGYDTVSSFFSEVFGLTVKVFGDISHSDDVMTQGSLGTGELLAVYGENGGLVGALTVGQSSEVEAGLKGLIRAHEPLTALNGNLAGVR